MGLRLATVTMIIRRTSAGCQLFSGSEWGHWRGQNLYVTVAHCFKGLLVTSLPPPSSAFRGAMPTHAEHYRDGRCASFHLAPLWCVALALLIYPSSSEGQSAISPSEHTSVSNVTNPGNAWDGNHGTFAAISLGRVCNSSCTSPTSATATFDGFPTGYSPTTLKVSWYAFTAFSVLPGNAGNVIATLEFDIGGGWQTSETYTWTQSSPACPTPSNQSITCFDHVASISLDPGQNPASVRVRVTVSAQLTQCSTCGAFGSSNLSAQAKIYEVWIDTACTVPTSETSTSLGWNGSYPSRTTHIFFQELAPSGSSFSGRKVKEFDAGGTTTDTCWFEGSAIDQATQVISDPGIEWTVGGDNSYGVDDVGNYEDTVAYFRAHAPSLPCSVTGPQQMRISCGSPTSFVPYSQNVLEEGIATTTVSSQRQSNYQERSWP
jgi:hypothetical protein